MRLSLYKKTSRRKSSRKVAVKKRKEKTIQKMGDASNNLPRWLNMLIHERILNPCSSHSSYTKNEKTKFCLECCLSFCPYCIHDPNHHYLQIRRCKGDEVVKVADIEKLIDCSFIQSYSVNRALVFYMKERTESKAMRAFGNFCDCGRVLDQESGACSLACRAKLCAKWGESMSICDHQQFSQFPRFGLPSHDNRNAEPEDPQKKCHRRKGNPVRSPCQ